MPTTPGVEPGATSKRLEQDILDSLLDGVITITADGRILTFNKAAERIFDYSSEEVAGENVRILMPEPFAGEHDQYLRNYLLSGNAKIIGTGRKVTGRRRDGSVFPMHLAISEGSSAGNRIFTGIVRDLSVEERAHARLRESFLLLFERSTEPMALTDGQGRFLDANPHLCHLVGMERSDLLNASVAQFLEGGVAENLRRRAMREEHGAVSSTAWLRTGDGRRIDVRYWEVQFEAEDGSTRVLIGANDASVEQELARATATLQALYDTSPDGQILTDEGGGTIFANRAHREIWAIGEDDLAKSFAERWPTTRARMVEPDRLARLSELARDEPESTPHDLLELTDGRVVEVRSQPVYGRNGERLGRSFTTRDVTTEARFEANLRESEERYRTLVSSLPVGIVMQYVDGRIGTANEAAEAILGLTRDQLVGLTSYDSRWRCIREDGTPCPPEEHPAVITRRTGQPVENLVLGVSHANGSLRWLLVNSQPIAGERGTLAGVVVSFQDITEQRLAEQAISHARTAEAFQALASGVAHKINNSLTSIVGNVYLAGLAQGLPEEAREGLAEVARAASDATALVRDLVALGGHHGALAPLDLSSEARQALATFSIAEVDRVTSDLGADRPPAQGDSAALVQAIASLIRNALEAGATVRITNPILEAFEPDPAGNYATGRPPPGRYLALQVEDDGPGLAPEMVGKLFEPFATTKFTGHGLGLAAAAGIMRTHGGFVEVISTSSGCRASLLFPLH